LIFKLISIYKLGIIGSGCWLISNKVAQDSLKNGSNFKFKN